MDNNSSCEFCCKTFTSKKNMYQHMRHVHKIEPDIPGRILCPISECSASVVTYAKLRNHLEEIHLVLVQKEEMLFPDKLTYLSWKEELERVQNISFVTEASKRLYKGRFSEGVPFDRILDDARNSSSIKRLCLLTRKDLINIWNSCSILKPERLHEDDTISVHLFTEKMKELGDASPVVFFKAQGCNSDCLDTDDFMLVLFTTVQRHMFDKFANDKVCIDTTHGTNMYNFHLTTLMVVDEFGRGFPSAFCLSNKISEKHMTVFFKAIKEKAPAVATKIFMSDDFPAYYNAWKNVMGEAEKQLLCIWHVDKNWRQSLNKIKNPEKKVAMYKFLRTVLEETDESKFELLLNKCIYDLENDFELNAFATYFKQQYANRAKLWAYCHRKYARINTNMYLESLHKVLKHIYMQGKINKRLDTCISLLLKLTQDKSSERYVRLIKGTNAEKTSHIYASHRESKNIPREDIKQISPSEWTVQSQSCKRVTYCVKKINVECTGCMLNCKLCNICLHDYSCSCIDCCIQGNMCKHIHAVVINEPKRSTLKQKKEHEILKEILENELNPQQNQCDQIQPVNTEQNKANQIQSIKHRFSLGLNLIEKSNLSDENYNEVKKHLDKVLSIIQSQNNHTYSKAANKEPVNKNLPLQRLHSTNKKRKRTKSSMDKPTTNYKRAILDTVENNSEMLTISYGDEHSYTKIINMPE